MNYLPSQLALPKSPGSLGRVVRKPVNVNPGLNVKQNTLPKSYKIENKILASPGLP